MKRQFGTELFDQNNVFKHVSIERKQVKSQKSLPNQSHSLTHRDKKSQQTCTNSQDSVFYFKFLDLMKFNSIQKIDNYYSSQPQYVVPYAQEIYEYMQKQSVGVVKDYFGGFQKEINRKMRCILVDWIVDVQFKLKMKANTLFLTVNYMDRYLEQVEIKREQLQLVGVSCMWMASKYEEIYAPQVKDLSYITERAYSKEEIINMEQQIVLKLDFKLSVPTLYQFLRRLQTICPMEYKHFFLAQYLLELYLVQGPVVDEKMAFGAFYLVRKIKRYDPIWVQELEMLSDMKEADVKHQAKELCKILQQAQSNSHYFQCVNKKFSSNQYFKIAQIRVQGRQKTQQDQPEQQEQQGQTERS